MGRRLARETGLCRSHHGLDLSREPPSACPLASTGLKIVGIFRALYIVMVGDIGDAGKSRRDWWGAFQVTPIGFSQAYSGTCTTIWASQNHINEIYRVSQNPAEQLEPAPKPALPNRRRVTIFLSTFPTETQIHRETK